MHEAAPEVRWENFDLAQRGGHPQDRGGIGVAPRNGVVMEPEFNLPLLRKAVEWVVGEAARPEAECEWYQGTWRVTEPKRMLNRSCGTAFCVAGYVCEVSGGKWYGNSHVLFPVAGEEGPVASFRTPNGDALMGPDDRAQRLLGIYGREAGRLFAGSNTAKDVVKIASEIARNHGEEL